MDTSSYQLPFPKPMTCTGDVAMNWQVFKEAFEDYVVATELSKKSQNIQVATLKTVMGDECKKILKRLNINAADMLVPAKILEALEAYFVPERNILYERYLFHGADQQANESVDQYFIRLRQLAELCKFNSMEDEMVRDRIVLGCKDKAARARLFREKEVDLQKALQSLRISEATLEQLKIMGDDSGTEVIHKMAMRDNRRRDTTDSLAWGKSRKQVGLVNKEKFSEEDGQYRKISCSYCGGTHFRNKNSCPAFGKKCNKCGIRNHFEAVCKRRNKQKLYQVQSDSESEAEVLMSSEVIGSIQVEAKKQFFADLKLGTIKKSYTKCQIDTGATCNVLPFVEYCDIMQHGNPVMEKSNSKLKLYDGTMVSALGECTLPCQLTKRTVNLNFKIVPGGQMPLLSGQTCVDLGLVTIHPINQIKQKTISLPIIEEFADLFNNDLGRLPRKYHIEMDPNIQPVQQSPRRVPIALKGRLMEKIGELEKKGIIKKVTEATPWINSLVAVVKPDKIRICIDSRDLNKAIKRPKYQMPTLDEVLPKLANAKVFSVLDAKDGFHQIELDRESSLLTTFWTPAGRYRYLRMPFGISSAPEEYQRRLHEIYEGIEGNEVIVDDILVYGCGDTEEEYLADHDRNLRVTLEKAREVNLKLNIKKLRLRLREVSYMGNLLTDKGLKPDPMKISAITAMPRPENKEAVQRFLGCVKYLSRFMPRLSDVSEPLRRLTEGHVVFHWQDQQENAFQALRQMLTEAPVLRYYDVKAEVTIQCDSSEKGLGAALLQNGQPVVFASRALTRTERCYAQIEKECLAILFACTRFAQYLHGRDLITIDTDHKPLVTIFKKDLHSAPKRLQRMLLSLQKFSLQVQYKPGRLMHIADMLSRAYLKEIKDNNSSTPEYQVCQLAMEKDLYKEIENTNQANYLHISDIRQKQLQTMTQEDPVLQELLMTVLRGWPDNKGKADRCIADYWLFRDEITASDGILYKGQKVIIPKAMRPSILARVHASHLGPEACVRRARDVVFWPGMNGEIKDKVSKCVACNEFLRKQQAEPLMTYPIPNRPWEMVGQDLFAYKDENYLITVDYFSDFWELDHLRDTTSESIVDCTKGHFARHGIPSCVCTDNGPQFISNKYEKFARDWEFSHTTSSPYHSQSNGKAESAVKIAKSIVKKAMRSGEDVQLAVLEWRNTPSKEDGFSPSQKLMSRRTKSMLPTSASLLCPAPATGIKEHIHMRRQKAKQQFDKHTRELPELQIGESVRIQPQEKRAPWKEAVVAELVAPRSYMVVTPDGKNFRRNRRFLRTVADKGELNEDENTITEFSDEQNVENKKNTSVVSDLCQEDTPQLKRELPARAIKPPKRFEDFVMDF